MTRADPDGPMVSVVVPTKNRAPYLANLLTALAHQEYANLEVVIVDDASNDRTPSILKRWQGPNRQTLRLDMPSGSYAARNRGWKAARGEIVAFTDDDCLPEPGWVSGLVRALKDQDLIGAQGVTLGDRDRSTPFTHQIDQRRPGPPYRTCNIAYRRWVLEQVGGFDESFRWYADNIFGLLAQRVGPIGFAPDARVRHPPRPREWRDRDAWLARFSADAGHRQILHRLGIEPVTAPRSALPLLLWIARPLLKQSMNHARYALRHPAAYLRQMPPMVQEKRELVAAMRMFWTGSRTVVPKPEPSFTRLPAEPAVSVVVMTRERPHLLNGLLETLAAQSWPHLETVIGNHGGSAEVAALASRYGAHSVTIPAAMTLGFARQGAAEFAHGDVVAFIDDDCLADSKWAEALVEALQTHPDWCGVQGRTEAEAGPPDSHAVRVHRPNLLYQTCNVAYRREALLRAKGFDHRFQGWFEDTALAARVLEHGIIGFDARALVIHRALPRHARGRAEWRRLLEDERLLATAYPEFYRRVRGPGFVAVVVFRWLLGSPIKTLARGLTQLPSRPHEYRHLVAMLARERIALLQALYDLYTGAILRRCTRRC